MSGEAPEDDLLDVDVFEGADDVTEEAYYPGIDPDGKERLPPFGVRFAAGDTSMAATGVVVVESDPPKFPPGSIARSEFV